MRNLLFFLLFLPLLSIAQKKQITLEDLYKKGTFSGESVPGFTTESNDSLFDPKDIKDESGKLLNFFNHVLSSDKKRILFFNGREPIYRHSSKANVYVYDVATKKNIKLNEGKVLHPTFSPNGNMIAYVMDNNLYLYNISTASTKAITSDGKWNFIINGNCDWVYEEEFSFTRAYQWSPEGNYIAYYRFDESNVKEYNMTIYDNLYNKDYRYKYPKAGEDNSKVEIRIYNVASGQDVKAQFEQGDIYIPRIKWSKADNDLVVFWMNRHQNNLKLLLTDAQKGSSKLLYEETNKYYIDIHDDWWFLKDGKNYIFASEMDGFNHLYLYSLDGKVKQQISKGNYDVANVEGVDEKNKLVYYTMAYPGPLDRNLFVTDFSGKKTKQLTKGEGWHRLVFNDDFTEFYDHYSTLNTPQVVTLFALSLNKKKDLTVKQVKVVNESSKLRSKMDQYNLSRAELIRIPNSKGDTLNGWMLKPVNFDLNKKYPVLFCNYGGPGSQSVANRFGSVSFWHQLLAQRGYIVVSVDNTGTGYRGEEFKKKTYLQLGKFEIEDQIDAAKYFSKLSYVDPGKIGHWGWSYGGFMSSLAITKGADVFSAAIAVAPVTSWRFYDNIYTERYMRTPKENPKGYDENAPINYADQIKGKFLIIHGTADDNVHFQNSVEMIDEMIKKNIDFESAYYPNRNHGISGGNTNYHLWSKMTEWIFKNLSNSNTTISNQKAF